MDDVDARDDMDNQDCWLSMSSLASTSSIVVRAFILLWLAIVLPARELLLPSGWLQASDFTYIGRA